MILVAFFFFIFLQFLSGLFGNTLAGKNGFVRLESIYKIFEGNLKCSSGGAAEAPGQCQCLDDLGDETCCQGFFTNN